MFRATVVSLTLLQAASAAGQALSEGQVEEIRPIASWPVAHGQPARIVVVVTEQCRGRACHRHMKAYRQPTRQAASSDRRFAEAHFREVGESDLAPEQLAADGAPEATPGTSAPESAPACGGPEESQAWRLLNAYRGALGLAGLSCDLAALQVARAHGQDMCARGYFDHFSPEGSAPWDRLRWAGVRFRMAGENIAMGHETAGAAHQGWLDSPSHRANIERPGWSRAAVGMTVCGNVHYWTQLFAR